MKKEEEANEFAASLLTHMMTSKSDEMLNTGMMHKYLPLKSAVCFGKVVGRIVKFEGDHIVDKDGNKIYSIVYFGTPHGSVTKMGRACISEPNKDNLKRLKEYEDTAKAEGVWYKYE